MLKVKFKKLHPDTKTPQYAKVGDAGMDLTAVSIEKNYDGLTDELTKITVDSGLGFEIPEGYVGLVFPRSSIQSTGVRLTNSVGVIDSGYRGSVKAVFDVIDYSLIDYEKGDRFCQLIILPYPQVEFEEVEQLSTTDRNSNGYGSTGNK
jgi:dUTP pyrophosphatase